MDAMEFVGIMSKTGKSDKKPVFRLGAIPGSYASGRPAIIFDGETEPTARTYPYLSSYTPAAGNRVLIAMVGNSGVILGRVV